MAQKFGEAFKQPIDFFTNKPIPGSLQQATYRDYNGVVQAVVTLEPARPVAGPFDPPPPPRTVNA